MHLEWKERQQLNTYSYIHQILDAAGLTIKELYQYEQSKKSVQELARAPSFRAWTLRLKRRPVTESISSIESLHEFLRHNSQPGFLTFSQLSLQKLLATNGLVKPLSLSNKYSLDWLLLPNDESFKEDLSIYLAIPFNLADIIALFHLYTVWTSLRTSPFHRPYIISISYELALCCIAFSLYQEAWLIGTYMLDTISKADDGFIARCIVGPGLHTRTKRRLLISRGHHIKALSYSLVDFEYPMRSEPLFRTWKLFVDSNFPRGGHLRAERGALLQEFVRLITRHILLREKGRTQIFASHTDFVFCGQPASHWHYQLVEHIENDYESSPIALDTCARGYLLIRGDTARAEELNVLALNRIVEMQRISHSTNPGATGKFTVLSVTITRCLIFIAQGRDDLAHLEFNSLRTETGAREMRHHKWALALLTRLLRVGES